MTSPGPQAAAARIGRVAHRPHGAAGRVDRVQAPAREERDPPAVRRPERVRRRPRYRGARCAVGRDSSRTQRLWLPSLRAADEGQTPAVGREGRRTLVGVEGVLRPPAAGGATAVTGADDAAGAASGERRARTMAATARRGGHRRPGQPAAGAGRARPRPGLSVRAGCAIQRQLAGEVVGALPAVVGVLGQARGDHAVEDGRRQRLEPRDRRRLRGEDRGDRGCAWLFPVEGAPPGQHLVEDRAEGEDVRARVGLLRLRAAPGAMYGHGADDGALRGQRPRPRWAARSARSPRQAGVRRAAAWPGRSRAAWCPTS